MGFFVSGLKNHVEYPNYSPCTINSLHVPQDVLPSVHGFVREGANFHAGERQGDEDLPHGRGGIEALGSLQEDLNVLLFQRDVQILNLLCCHFE